MAMKSSYTTSWDTIHQSKTDTAELLAELGYDTNQIVAMTESRAIG